MIRALLPDRSQRILLLAVLSGFLLLTPLGRFSDWVPERLHQGPLYAFYSLTDLDISDEGGKYVYMPSLFFDGDLDFSDDWELNVQAFTATSTGVARNYWTIGPALLWFPFFLLGHGAALLYQGAGYPVASDGYAFCYLTFTGLGTVVWAFAGLLALAAALRRFVPERTALWIALAAFLASVLPYYAFVQTRMDHALEAAGMSFLLLAALRAIEAPGERTRWLALGVAAGLVGVIRLNGIAAWILALPLLLTEPGTRDPIWRWTDPATAWSRIRLFALGFLPVYAAQMLASWTFFGRPFGSGDPAYGVEMALGNAGNLLRPGPHLSVWLSGRYGVLWSMPLLALGLAGLARIAFRSPGIRILAISALVYAFALHAMEVMMDDWGHGYGYRRLSSLVPLSAAGIAALWPTLSTRLRPRSIALAAGALVAWQYLQVLQHRTWLPFDDGSFILNALGNVLSILGSPAELLRSSSWLAVVLRGGARLADYRDVHFLLLLPLLLAAMLLAACAAWNGCRALQARPRLAQASAWIGWLLLVAALSPVLWIGLHPPRKDAQEGGRGMETLASLASKIRACAIAPPVYRHPLDDLLERARPLARELRVEIPDLEMIQAMRFAETGRTEEARSLLREVAERSPPHAEAARRLLARLDGAPPETPPK